MPTGRGRSGIARVSSSSRACSSTAALIAWRGESKIASASSPRKLDHRAVPSLDLLADDVREPRRQRGGRLVTALLGEDGVSTDVRDQERPDLLSRAGKRRATFLADTGSNPTPAERAPSPAYRRVSSFGFQSARPRDGLLPRSRPQAQPRRLRTAGKKPPAVLTPPPPTSHVVLMRATDGRGKA